MPLNKDYTNKPKKTNNRIPMNSYPIKNFIAGAAIGRYLIVKFGGDDDTVVPAAAATDALIGINGETDVENAAGIDVYHSNVHQVRAGGAITRGDLITSDADGKAVTAAPATGVNNAVIGRALASGVAEDIIPVLISPGQIQGA